MFFKNIMDLFYPKTCFGCKKEGKYLCFDCLSTLEILNYQYCLCNSNPKRVVSIFNNGKCIKCKDKKLDGLFFAFTYENNNLVKRMIHNFKYPPFVKDLALSFSQIFSHYFNLSDFNSKILENFIVIPIPLERSRERWRGFNQSYEIAKNLDFLNMKINNNSLVKIKKTKLHSRLSKGRREKNILDSFKIIDNSDIKGKNILLIDDVYTTGATMEECAKILKSNGAKKILGMVIARN